jgi:Major tropism determinant N-terminal domain
LATLIQVRRDTLTNWNTNNPVLANGEIAFVTDQNKFKVGNGSSNFSSLPYLQADAYTDSVILGTDTTGDYVAQVTASGSGISVTGSGESASVTISNTGVTSLTGTASEVEVSASTGAITIGLPSTINADTTGNAATATSLQTARTINLGGDLSGSASFNGTSDITINATVDSQSSVNSLTGTANEIEVSASVGDITLSLPTTINANTTGTAASLTTARTIALSGDVSGSVTFDGSASVDITTTIQPDSVSLGTDTTGDYVSSVSASGSGISVSGTGESALVTIQNTGVVSLAGSASQIAVSASNGDVTVSLPSAVTFPGTVTLNANPEQALQAATKQYVDAVAEGLHVHPSVATATTASVDLNDAPASIDGVNLSDGMRVLVKNQSNTADNGIYTYSASADALVRASDFNSTTEIAGGDFLFVTGGSTYDNTGWVQTEKITTLGTDPILFTQFSGAGTYLAGTGLELVGSTFNNIGVLSIAGTGNEIDVSASSGNITLSLPATINADTTGNAATVTNGALTTGKLSQFSATTSSELAGVISDETGTGSLVFASGPSLSGTPTAPTAAVDTNTTQIATTAYVIGQGYLKTSSASAAYQPLDSDLTAIAAIDPISSGMLKTDVSSSLSTWTTVTSNFGNNFDSSITSIDYGNDIWVAGGSYGKIRTSTNGSTWTTQTSNFGNTKILSIAYGNGLWIAGGESGQMRTSTDTTTWTTVTSNFSSSIFSIAYANGLWVAGGYYGIMRTSTDATTWTTVTSNFGNTNINSITYGNGLWVAGGDQGQIRTSTDGSTWTTVTSNFASNFTGRIFSISYGNGLWVAGGSNSNMRTSTNGSTWTTVTSNFGATRINSITYGNGLWFAGGYYGSMRTSTNGSVWTTVTSNLPDSSVGTIYSIAYANEVWVAGAAYGNMRKAIEETSTSWSIDTNAYLTSTAASSTYAPLVSPTLTTPNIGVATGTSFNSITGLSSTNPVMDGTVAVGTGTTVARADHVHPTDTSRAPLESPTFTGTLTSPTVLITTADTATAASHYIVETASDGILRPKTLANVQAEIVTNTQIQSVTVSPTAAGSTGIRRTTMSTSAPTGGNDGDVWLLYT